MGQREMSTLNSKAAADWWTRLQNDDLSAEERAEFDRWLDADPAHAVAFARVELTWEEAKRLQAAAPMPATHRVDRTRWAWAAAVVGVIVGLGVWYVVWQANAYTTAIGERRSVALEDGSRIELNTASRMEVDLGEQQRVVRLVRGEGSFSVAPDAQRPFLVIAGDATVRAVGTAFNVRVRDRHLVEVTVTEGVVAIGDQRVSADAGATVVAGQVNRTDLPKDALERRVAWREGVIALKGETLAQAVEEFNRYRERKLIIADPSIASIRIGGRFATDDVGKFLNAIGEVFPVKVVEGEDDQVFLLRRP